jgi:hAT family C-terminal dimerisation region
VAPRPPKRTKILGAIDEHIAQFTKSSTASTANDTDEYERWKRLDPLPGDHSLAKNPIQYWLDLRTEYPTLSQMALDILTIPASSADCERIFSELGDLLEPRRLKMKPATISAIQCTRSWVKKGFTSTASRGSK